MYLLSKNQIVRLPNVINRLQEHEVPSSVSVVQVEPMALSRGYWEQSANALKNLFDLQCWASSVGIYKVVESEVSSSTSAGLLQLILEENSTTCLTLITGTGLAWDLNILPWQQWSSFC